MTPSRSVGFGFYYRRSDHITPIRPVRLVRYTIVAPWRVTVLHSSCLCVARCGGGQSRCQTSALSVHVDGMGLLSVLIRLWGLRLPGLLYYYLLAEWNRSLSYRNESCVGHRVKNEEASWIKQLTFKGCRLPDSCGMSKCPQRCERLDHYSLAVSYRQGKRTRRDVRQRCDCDVHDLSNTIHVGWVG